MIYLDSSVALAWLLAEDRRPSDQLLEKQLVASRLLEYELFTRLHAIKRIRSHGIAARALLDRIAFVELTVPVLERALDPFPLPIRTLDALHLATMDFLRRQRQHVVLASYDNRMIRVARKLGFKLHEQ